MNSALLIERLLTCKKIARIAVFAPSFRITQQGGIDETGTLHIYRVEFGDIF